MRLKVDGRREPPRGGQALVVASRRGMRRAAPWVIATVALAVVVGAYYVGYEVLPRDVATRDARGLMPTEPTPRASPAAETTPTPPSQDATLLGQARLAAVQALGGIVLALGAVLTVRTLRLTREGQITDRFTAAVEQLGHAEVTVRVAAIHALGRIARDSRADHGAVMAILGDHLRQTCPWVTRSEEHSSAGPTTTLSGSPHPEVHAAAVVLRERRRGREMEEGVLDFSGVDLRNAPLSGARLRGADFADANLHGAYLNGTDLREAVLVRTDLGSASLRHADLRHADVVGAQFSNADAQYADFRHVPRLRTARFESTLLYKAKLPKGATLRGDPIFAPAAR